jgi:hypothetical protein
MNKIVIPQTLFRCHAPGSGSAWSTLVLVCWIRIQMGKMKKCKKVKKCIVIKMGKMKKCKKVKKCIVVKCWMFSFE